VRVRRSSRARAAAVPAAGHAVVGGARGPATPPEVAARRAAGLAVPRRAVHALGPAAAGTDRGGRDPGAAGPAGPAGTTEAARTEATRAEEAREDRGENTAQADRDAAGAQQGREVGRPRLQE